MTKEAAKRKSGDSRGLLYPNNVITVPTEFGTDFFKWWCVFLRPFVNLTNREVDVIASFLRQRWELSKSVLDPAILDKILMSEDVRQKVLDECQITSQNLSVVMSGLRKNKVIIDNIINPRLIPNIRSTDNGTFQLLILFKEKKSSNDR